MTEDFRLIKRDKDIPAEADFSIVLRDGAMEPLLHSGQTLYVSCRASLWTGSSAAAVSDWGRS